MEAPKIHAFSDDVPHRAEDLNAMGVTVLNLVEEINYLRRVIAAMHEELEEVKKAAKPAGRAANK